MCVCVCVCVCVEYPRMLFLLSCIVLYLLSCINYLVFLSIPGVNVDTVVSHKLLHFFVCMCVGGWVWVSLHVLYVVVLLCLYHVYTCTSLQP